MMADDSVFLVSIALHHTDVVTDHNIRGESHETPSYDCDDWFHSYALFRSA